MACKARQKTAFDAEVALWKHEDTVVREALPDTDEAADLVEDETLVAAHMCGSVWKVPVTVGQSVAAGDTLVIIEAMKMELAVIAPAAGVLRAIRCTPGKQVNSGDALVALAEETVSAPVL